MNTPSSTEISAAVSYLSGRATSREIHVLSQFDPALGIRDAATAILHRVRDWMTYLETSLDTYAPPVLQDGEPVFDSFGNVLRRDFRASTQIAEARVAELEAQLEDAECCVTKYARAGERAKARIAELEELHSMQLAAISTATIQNTVKSTADRIPPDNPYSTVAYADVCRAVDREMRERQRAETAEARVKELEERLKGTLQAGGYQYFYEQLHAAEREAGNARYVAEQAQKKVAELEAQNARLRVGLESLQSDAQCTIDLYNKIGPTWTSRDSGAEYYDASYVIGSAEERIATIKAALADTKGTT